VPTQDVEEKIIELYRRGYSQRAIEKLLGISRKTIRRVLLRHGVEIRVHYKKLDWSKRETIAYLLGVLLGDGYVREGR